VIDYQRTMTPRPGHTRDELSEDAGGQSTAKDVLIASNGSDETVHEDGFHFTDSGCVTWSDGIISMGGEFGDLNGQREISSDSPSLNDCFSDFGELEPPSLIFAPPLRPVS